MRIFCTFVLLALCVNAKSTNLLSTKNGETSWLSPSLAQALTHEGVTAFFDMPRPNPEKDKQTRAAKLLRTQVCGVYKITTPDGSIYIGASRHIKERTRKHEHRGVVEIMVTLPTDVPRDLLDLYETLVHNQFRDCGFKMLNVREPGWTGKNTEAMKSKMSLDRKGKPSKTKGIKMSEESKIKMRIASKLRIRVPHSEETKQRMRDAWNLRKKNNPNERLFQRR